MAKRGRRTGQIIERGPGRWLVRVYVGRDESGKRKDINRTIHGRRKDAQAALTKLLRELDTGEYVEESKLTVGDFLEGWLAKEVKHRVRARTHADYDGICHRRLIPRFGSRRLTQLTSLAIRDLYAEMKSAGLSARTIRYTHAVLRNALASAVKHRQIRVNPADAVDLPKREHREMKSWTPEQAMAFLAAIEGDELAPLFTLLLYSGLRPSEALALRWSDLDGSVVRVVRTLVRVRGEAFFEEPKTARSKRSVPLPAPAMQALRKHRVAQWTLRHEAGRDWQDQDLIFAHWPSGGPVHVTDVSRRFRLFLEGRNDVPRIRLYDLRHSMASLLLKAGEDLKVVSARLGHASIVLTADTYAHLLPGMQEAASEKLERMLAGTGTAP